MKTQVDRCIRGLSGSWASPDDRSLLPLRAWCWGVMACGCVFLAEAGDTRRHRACSAIGDASLVTRPGCVPGAFHRVLQSSPLRRQDRWRVLPRARGLASARCCHTPNMCRPRGFSPPRRIAPPTACRHIAACCRPWGSPGFRLPRPRVRDLSETSSPTPHPPERSPPPVAGPCITAGPCPLAVRPTPSARTEVWGWHGTRPRGLAPPGSPLCTRDVAADAHPRLSWASLPETSVPPSTHRQADGVRAAGTRDHVRTRPKPRPSRRALCSSPCPKT